MSAFAGKADINAKLPTRDEARRTAANIAKLPEGLVAHTLNCLRRQVERIFKLTSAAFAEPHVPNTMIRHMLGRFRCDHISATECTFTTNTLVTRRAPSLGRTARAPLQPSSDPEFQWPSVFYCQAT